MTDVPQEQMQCLWVCGRFFLRHSSAPSEVLRGHKDPADSVDGQEELWGAFLGVLTTPTPGLSRQQAAPEA